MYTVVRLRLNELKSSLSHVISTGSQQRCLFSFSNQTQSLVWHSQKRYAKNSRYGKSSNKSSRLSPRQVDHPLFTCKQVNGNYYVKFLGNPDITSQ